MNYQSEQILENAAEQKNFILYSLPNNKVGVNVLLQDETIWLTLNNIAELFGTTKQNVSLHFKNIYGSGELVEMSTVKKILTVQNEGTRKVSRELEYYNLDAIISVGYRVNSIQATQFRIWATQTLKEFIIKGFVLDDERLKQGNKVFGKDYFRELLDRVRSIRASERRIYQQVTDIFSECCIDYNQNSEITKSFFAMMQNKFHYAITGKTAAEIIYQSADHSKVHMGLTTWKNAPDGRVIKSDVIVAKNYLAEKEIKQLERTVSSYFDYIEGVIERQQELTMEKFAQSVDKFLSFNEYKILDNKGGMSNATAENKAKLEYDKFNKTQKVISDFDKFIAKELKNK